MFHHGQADDVRPRPSRAARRALRVVSDLAKLGLLCDLHSARDHRLCQSLERHLTPGPGSAGGPGDRDRADGAERDADARNQQRPERSRRKFRFPALAMALGDVAVRNKLEVRVIPRMDSAGPSVLVLFGSRTYRSKKASQARILPSRGACSVGHALHDQRRDPPGPCSPDTPRRHRLHPPSRGVARTSRLSSRLAPSSARLRSAAAATGSSNGVWRLTARG